MARSIYFSEQVRSEQSLYEDIVIEALKIYGYDMYYLPRDIVNQNDLLNEDVSSRFNSAYMIEMYVDNIEGFDGQGDIFQKFGVEIRDNVTLTMSRRRWNQAIKRHDNELTSERPLEGDLVYVPFSRKLFQIMRVEHEQPFYQVTNLPTYKLYCELFEFAGDDFDTGVAVVDEIERSYAYKYILSIAADNATATASLDPSGNFVNQITITSNGTGYTSVPVVEVSAPTATATTARLRAISDGNSITSVEILDSGQFYSIRPVVEDLTPTPGDQFKFGDNSLYHDSANAQYVLTPRPTGIQADNRLVWRWFYWPESSGQDYNSLLNFGNTYQIYHRTSDNKIVFQDSAGEYVHPTSVTIYDSDTRIGFWNYIELHWLNNTAKLHVNGDDMDVITTLGGGFLNHAAAGDYTLGKPSADVSGLFRPITQSFKGYIDHFVWIETGDTEFRDPDPIPTTTAQVNRDGDTLRLGTFIREFDNTVPSFTVNTFGGRVTSVTVDDGGTNMLDSAYTLTVSAPTGTAADFTAKLVATIANGSVTTVDFTTEAGALGGGYNGVAPTITIRPQGAGVDYNVGDKVFQTLTSGVVLEGEVAKYSDSDYKIHVINVQTSDGNYHDFTTNIRLNVDSANGAGAFVIAVEEVNQLSNNEQNDTFSTEAASFLDFSETNPFGDPENS